MSATNTPTTAEPTAAPAPQPNPAPAPSAVDMNTLDPEQVNAIREKIRLEERAKLSTKLDTHAQLQETVSSLNTEKTQLEQELSSTKTQAQTDQQALAALQKSVSDSNEVDTAKLIKEVNEEAEKRFEKRFHSTVTDLESKVEKMNTENVQLRVETYKQQRMAQLRSEGKQFIAELVTGNTDAEVEQSLQNAVDKYIEYFGTSAAPANTPPNSPAAPAPAPAVAGAHGPAPVTQPAEPNGQPHAQPSAPAADEGLAGIVSSLKGQKGKAQFSENREALLAAAANEHSQMNQGA